MGGLTTLAVFSEPKRRLSNSPSRAPGRFLSGAVDILMRVSREGAGRDRRHRPATADVGLKIAGTSNPPASAPISSTFARFTPAISAWSIPTTPCFVRDTSGERGNPATARPRTRPLVRSLIVLTKSRTLARKSDVAVVQWPLDEVRPLGLAPKRQHHGDDRAGRRLAFVLSQEREFTHEDFARFHPAGSSMLPKVEARCVGAANYGY